MMNVKPRQDYKPEAWDDCWGTQSILSMILPGTFAAVWWLGNGDQKRPDIISSTVALEDAYLF